MAASRRPASGGIVWPQQSGEDDIGHGAERGLSLEQLQEAINRYLAPWQFDPEAEIVIGTGEVAERALLTYMEKLPYVESVARFAIMHRFMDEPEEHYRLIDTALSGTRVVLRPSLPWAVLV